MITMDIIKEILSIFSSTAAIAILVIGATLMIYGFKLLCSKLGITVSDATMTEIIAIISQVIKYLDQKFVDSIKKNSSDNKLTDYQKDIIKNKCIGMIKDILNSEQVDFLLEKYNMSDIDDVLDILIESTIKDTRTNNETIIINESETTDLSNVEENISSTYIPTDNELESISLCPGNCKQCSVSDYCDICRE